jgi:transcription elongation factor Elf1
MTLEDHSECPIPRDEVESILDDEIEETASVAFFMKSSNETEYPPSPPSWEHEPKKKCYRCEKFDVTLTTSWKKNLLTSNKFKHADVSCANCGAKCRFKFDEKSEEYVEKALM